MATYQFLTDGHRPLALADGDGFACDDDGAALREAALTAAAMAKDELAADGPARSFAIQVMQGGRAVGSVRVDVSIEAGHL